MNLTQLFDASLLGRARREALEFQGTKYTFGDLEARSNRMARFLRRRGVRVGDRVCVYLPNGLEFLDLFLACVKIGALLVPINILYREREIGHIVSDSEPALLVDGPELAAAAAQESASRPELPALDGEAPAALVYTSGTTGASKGAVLTHNNFLANTANLVTCWQITERDRLLLALPLFHVHGLGNGVHCWLAAGMHVRLLERFEHQSAAAEFLDYAPSLFFGVPTMYVRLLEVEEEVARRIGASLRLCVSGSAPLPAQVLGEFEQRFGQRILERYGMTETLMNLGNPYSGERRAGTVGVPFPGVAVRILDEGGREVPEGESGELHIKGPNVFAGYWRREEATRAAFRDGWFRTGDIGRRSADGYYTLEGRRSDLIISGGFNIYPREVEEFLQEQPEVAEAAVVGMPDALRGEVPIAFVVLREGCTAEGLEERCRRSLASFKVPRRVEPVDALPRNALGKVQKHLLVTSRSR